MINTTKIRFLGSSTARPETDNDTASYVINEQIVVDTGWNVVRNLKKYNIDPVGIQYLFFTHMHHDHYLSLPSFLFELISAGKNLEELTIVGPVDDVERVVKLALEFLQVDHFFQDISMPTIIPLEPGQSLEAAGFNITTCGTMHPVQGLCYRFNNDSTSSAFAITGDTAFHPPLADFIKGCSVLITEASLGPGRANPEKNEYMHSGADDAAQLAVDAEVNKLFLVHGPKKIVETSVQSAQKIFKGLVQWPYAGQEIEAD